MLIFNIMVDTKELKKQIKNHYIELFYKIVNDNKQLKLFKRINLGNEFDDWKNIRYESNPYLINDNWIKFSIKKNKIRLSLRVEIKKDLHNSTKYIRLYDDFFYLKKYNKMKNILLNVVNLVQTNSLLSLTDNGDLLLRKIKINKIKSK
jgi:hypothetical protein